MNNPKCAAPARCYCSATGEHDQHECECGGTWRVDDGQPITVELPHRFVGPRGATMTEENLAAGQDRVDQAFETLVTLFGE